MTGMLGPLHGAMADGAEPSTGEIAAAALPTESAEPVAGAESTPPADPAEPSSTGRTSTRRPLPEGAVSVADEILGRSAGSNRPVVAVRVGDTVHELGDRPLVFGRRPDADVVVVPDGRVSRRHAAIEYDQSTPVVRDVGSTNGTQVRRDGTTIVVGSTPVPLRVGDVVLTIDGLVLGTVVASPSGAAR
ncbi:MAG: hypothetical protein CL424_03180 [Acidimicrobiaceae bacterium]|nr:hypothetical protein [Acidimicrobiaceae bacterium]